MSADTDLETTLRRYVLGELKSEERLELEERLITAPEVFESLGVVEDDLAEEYVNGRLSETERMGFEGTFLCTADRRWHVRFIRMLKDHASAAVMVAPKSQTYPAKHAPGDKLAGAVAASESGTGFARPERNGRRWSLGALASLLKPQPAQPQLVLRLALAAALVVLVAGNLWFAGRSLRLESEVTRLSATQQEGQMERRQLQTRVEELSAQARLPNRAPAPGAAGPGAAGPRASAPGAPGPEAIASSAAVEPTPAVAAPAPASIRRPPARALAPPVAPAIPTFALTMGLLRGEGSLTRIALPAGAEVVRLRLPVAAIDYPLYRVALEDADGEEIWAHSRLTAGAGPGGAVIVALLPADLLKPGDYQLKLSGSDGSSAPESVGSYSFRVAGRATTPR